MGPAGLGAEPAPVAGICPHEEREKGRPPACAGLWGHMAVADTLFWAEEIIQSSAALLLSEPRSPLQADHLSLASSPWAAVRRDA